MNWLRSFLGSSIGKKQFASLTGLLLSVFLLAHLAGNILLLKGPEEFNRYARYLGGHPLLLPAEAGLAVLFLAHIVMGLKLAWENWRARPQGYLMHTAAGGRTIGSATMPYTGLFMLGFLFLHVYSFRIQGSEQALFSWEVFNFKIGPYTGFYIAAMLALGLHLSHGWQSALQSFGLHHPPCARAVRVTGAVLAAALAAAFAALPLWGFLR